MAAAFGERDVLSPAGKTRLAEPWGAAWSRRGLLARVHFDAFRTHPAKYLQAVSWRIRGLRVRSRNRFAALKGKSPNAYALWIASREQPAVRGEISRAGPERAEIVPLIACAENDDGVERTVASLARAGFRHKPIMLGLRSVAQSIPKGGADAETWLCLLNAGDEVSAHAREIYAIAAAQSPERSLIYADDDLIDDRGVRHSPHFKPAWNPELFRHHDFVSGSAIVRADGGWWRGQASGKAINGLLESAIQAREPLHVPFVLHHRQRRPEPINPAGSRPAAAGRADPSVDVVIPTRNGVDLLRACIDGLRKTDYGDLRVTVVDNGSDDPETLDYLAELNRGGARLLKIPGPFNYSALNNAAVQETGADFLCFLNNDIEIGDPDWLSILVHQALPPDRGAVGARLLYPDGTIQHAGVVTGVGGGAGHAHRFEPADGPGYFRRACLPQRVSAVTAACLVVAREKFLSVGGFDETDFPVAFNDVDLCLKLNARGWQSFYEPAATLIHHESKSRGSDRDRIGKARLAAELQALKRKWHTDRVRDPYHHVHLSPFSEQFVIAV